MLIKVSKALCSAVSTGLLFFDLWNAHLYCPNASSLDFCGITLCYLLPTSLEALPQVPLRLSLRYRFPWGSVLGLLLTLYALSLIIYISHTGLMGTMISM